MRNIAYDDNWDENNIENVKKMIEDEKNEETKLITRMVISNHGAGVIPHISEKSRKICAKSLLE